MDEIKRNTRAERARQFAPFDALSGFFELIAEREAMRCFSEPKRRSAFINQTNQTNGGFAAELTYGSDE